MCNNIRNIVVQCFIAKVWKYNNWNIDGTVAAWEELKFYREFHSVLIYFIATLLLVTTVALRYTIVYYY